MPGLAIGRLHSDKCEVCSHLGDETVQVDRALHRPSIMELKAV